jgi:hypothetical protein
MPPPVRDVLGPVATRFLDKYRGQLKLFDRQHEVAPASSSAALAATRPDTASSAGVGVASG